MFGFMYPFDTANTANFIILSYPVLLRISVMAAFTDPSDMASSFAISLRPFASHTSRIIAISVSVKERSPGSGEGTELGNVP